LIGSHSPPLIALSDPSGLVPEIPMKVQESSRFRSWI
jgi:hypothetical protein